MSVSAIEDDEAVRVFDVSPCANVCLEKSQHSARIQESNATHLGQSPQRFILHDVRNLQSTIG